MRKIQSVAVLLGMLASLTACSVTQIGRQPREGDSLALSVALAAGYSPQRLRDSRGPLPENLNPTGGSAVGSAVGGLVDVGGLAATIASPLPGFTSLAGGAMAGASMLFLRSDVPPPEAGIRILAWMPTSLAPDPDAAKLLLVRTAAEALDKGMQEVGLSGQYTYALVDNEYPFPGRRVRLTDARFELRMPPCTTAGYYCWAGVSNSMNAPAVVEAPSFIGTGPAYLFRHNEAGGIGIHVEDRREFVHRRIATLPSLDAMVATSRHLPSWAYIYAGPARLSYREPGTDRFVFLQAPVVLHQGRILPFIRGHDAPVSRPANG